MQIRQIISGFAVSPQIRPEDVTEVKAAGFTTVICNRPDAEVSGDERSEAIGAACAGAGLAFHTVPVDHTGLTAEVVERQRQLLETAPGPVLAYCRSGTRSCHAWAFGSAGAMPVDGIITSAARGGYDLEPMRAALEQASRQRRR